MKCKIRCHCTYVTPHGGLDPQNAVPRYGFDTVNDGHEEQPPREEEQAGVPRLADPSGDGKSVQNGRDEVDYGY